MFIKKCLQCCYLFGLTLLFFLTPTKVEAIVIIPIIGITLLKTIIFIATILGLPIALLTKIFNKTLSWKVATAICLAILAGGISLWLSINP